MDHRTNLLLLLRQRLTTLFEAMPAAQAGDTRSVHQARVATRRLRGALPVLRRSVDAQMLARVRKQVRTMTRALGPVRELDVALGHVRELAAHRLVSPRALDCVRDDIARERLSRRRDMLMAITPKAMATLRTRLARVTSGPPAERSADTIQEAQAQVVRRATQLREAVRAAGGLYLADRLHAVRVAAKKLRYVMEVVRELQRSRATARISQLKRLQDLLGHMHDCEMLIARTRLVQTRVARHDRRLASELDRLIVALEGECRRDHASYMRRRASILRLCDTLIAGAEPAVA